MRAVVVLDNKKGQRERAWSHSSSFSWFFVFRGETQKAKVPKKCTVTSKY